MIARHVHRCICAPGYTGPTCARDINECESKIAPCGKKQCFNTIGSYHCNYTSNVFDGKERWTRKKKKKFGIEMVRLTRS